MFKDFIDRDFSHIENIEHIPAFDLRSEAVMQEVSTLGQRLWDGDWSVVDRLGLLHMRPCAFMAQRIASKYRQDVGDMVGWANLGIIDACAKVMAHSAVLTNLTGYIFTRAKSLCLNNIVESGTGLSIISIRTMIAHGWEKPKHEDLPEDLIDRSISDPIAQSEFLDEFLPMLEGKEFDLFCLLLRCYSDEEAGEELNIKRARIAWLKSNIENKFETWMRKNYGPSVRRFANKKVEE